MANDSSVKPRKKKGGWIAIEEPPADHKAKTVAIPSPPSPTLSLTWHDLYEVFSGTIGNYVWRLFNEGKTDLTADQRIAMLEAALGDLPLSVQNVRALISELHKSDDRGWTLAVSFGALVRVAKDWLDQNSASVEPLPESNQETQSLLDALNRRDFAGAPQ